MGHLLTTTGRSAFSEAKAEAVALGHGHVGTEHVLIGLARTRDGLAAQVLEQAGAWVDGLRAAVVRLVGPGDVDRSVRRRPATARVVAACEAAARHARRFEAPAIAPEHLLLGILEDRDAFACRMLRELGISPEEVARALERRLARRPSPRHALAALPVLAAGAPLLCPRGHGFMDALERQGVKLAVCGSCLATFLGPGELERLVGVLAPGKVAALRWLLDGRPEVDAC